VAGIGDYNGKWISPIVPPPSPSITLHSPPTIDFLVQSCNPQNFPFFMQYPRPHVNA